MFTGSSNLVQKSLETFQYNSRSVASSNTQTDSNLTLKHPNHKYSANTSKSLIKNKTENKVDDNIILKGVEENKTFYEKEFHRIQNQINSDFETKVYAVKREHNEALDKGNFFNLGNKNYT